MGKVSMGKGAEIGVGDGGLLTKDYLNCSCFHNSYRKVVFFLSDAKVIEYT